MKTNPYYKYNETTRKNKIIREIRAINYKT